MSDSDEPREYSLEEIREEFLENIKMIVKYWVELESENNTSEKSDVEWRLDGLAFSILSMLDGCACYSPGFALIPTVHRDDKQYNIESEDDYYPYFEPEGDIREDRMLHEDYYADERNERNKNRE